MHCVEAITAGRVDVQGGEIDSDKVREVFIEYRYKVPHTARDM